MCRRGPNVFVGLLEHMLLACLPTNCFYILHKTKLNTYTKTVYCGWWIMGLLLIHPEQGPQITSSLHSQERNDCHIQTCLSWRKRLIIAHLLAGRILPPHISDKCSEGKTWCWLPNASKNTISLLGLLRVQANDLAITYSLHYSFGGSNRDVI